MGILDTLFGMSPEQSRLQASDRMSAGGRMSGSLFNEEQNRGLSAAAMKILDMSAPSRVPVNFMRVVAHGANAFHDGVQSHRDDQAALYQRDMQQRLLDWKVKDAEADFGHQQGNRSRDGRIAQRVAGIWGGAGGAGGMLSGVPFPESESGSAGAGSSGMPGAAGGIMNPEGLTPASHMNGSVFTAAAARAGLPDDMATLNKIVDGVNRGMSPDDAAAAVAGESGMQGQQGGSTPQQGPVTGQQGMSMPTTGSAEWMRGIEQQAAQQHAPSLNAPFTADANDPQFWLQSAMPGRTMGSARSAGAGMPGAKGGASAPNDVDWLALGLPPQTALNLQKGQRRNRTQEMIGNLMTKAQIQFEEGDPTGAEKTLDLIQKFRPNATWKEVRQGDKVVNMPFYDDGQPGEASDAEVAARLHWQDTGGSTLGLDAFDGSVRARHKNGLSPSAAATIGMQRERLAFDKQQAGRPVFNESMGGYMLPPSQQNPTGVFIPAPGRRSPKMTEDQAKATGWVVQAENAWKNMQAVAFGEDGKLTSAATPGFGDAVAALPFGIGESSGNHFRSADRQKFIQGASSLSESLLRAATGAGVNRDEAIQKTREITPVWGDSSEVIEQKLNSIPLYIDSLKARAGPGAGVANEVIEKDAARHAGQAAGKYSITAPNGQTYTFPDAKSLANFKLTAGIR